jgi:hypothetical protein
VSIRSTRSATVGLATEASGVAPEEPSRTTAP